MSNYVISISREFGSGGRLIGKRLAAQLGIHAMTGPSSKRQRRRAACPRTLLPVRRSGPAAASICPSPPIGIGTPAFAHQGVPVSHQAFFAQADVIRELADEGRVLLWGGAATMCWGIGQNV